MGDFPGFESLPDVSQFKTFDLPHGINASCFDLESLNHKGDAVLSCQTIPQSEDEDPQDLICVIEPEDNAL